MDQLVKKKLNDERMNQFFVRINRSLENTIKDIYKKKYPSPLDNPAQANNIRDDLKKKHIEQKRKRDDDLERILRRHGY
jgi:hypothetical protein